MGTSEYTPETVHLFSDETSVSLDVVFALFFPALTGFTAGNAMSEDLKNSKKSIPLGTLSAIGVGLVIYLGLAVFIALNVNSEGLKTDYNFLMKMALFTLAVVAGIWGAILSSALGGILRSSRILKVISINKVIID
ncbi:amino acid permease [Algibacter agarivorans]|uniref:amino acid permease n=1 Tax=Algibacter agarivorans TaxID=1109741 RepID=UPI0031ECDFCF